MDMVASSISSEVGNGSTSRGSMEREYIDMGSSMDSAWESEEEEVSVLS